MNGPSLSREASEAMRWNAASGGVTLVSQFIQLAVMARFLPPREFGLAATAISVAGLLQGLSDLGLPGALVQRTNLEDKAWSSALWACSFAGIFLAVALGLTTTTVESLLKLPGLTPLLVAAALTVPWSGPAAIFQSDLQRRLRFATLARIEILSALVSLAVALAYCLWRRDAMALLAGQIALGITRCIGMGWRSPVSFRSRPDFSTLQSLRSFAGYQMGQHALTYAMANMDRLLVARLLGATSAGLYSVASQIALRPLALLGPFMIRTLFPLLARMQQDPERLQSSFLRSLSLLGLLSAAVYSLMFGLAEPLTRLVLGPGWEPALPTLRALTVLGFLWVMMNPLGSLALALGRAGTGFWLNALMIGANAAGVLIGSRYGILGVATGMVLATLLLSPIDFFLMWRWIGLSPVKAVREAGWPLLPGAVTAAALTVIGMISRSLPAWVSLAQGTVAGMAAFAATAWLFRGKRLQDAFAELMIKLKGN